MIEWNCQALFCFTLIDCVWLNRPNCIWIGESRSTTLVQNTFNSTNAWNQNKCKYCNWFLLGTKSDAQNVLFCNCHPGKQLYTSRFTLPTWNLWQSALSHTKFENLQCINLSHLHSVDQTYRQTPSAKNDRLPAVSENLCLKCVSRNYRLPGDFENSRLTVISSGRCLPGGTIPAM